MKNIYILSLLALFIISCSPNNQSKFDKIQNSRNNIINVKDQIHEVSTGDVLCGTNCKVVANNKYLIIGDYKSTTELIHIFDINTFKHLITTGTFGQGPNEIGILGDIVWNETSNEVYVTDNAKFIVYSYNIDSLLLDNNYLPYIKTQFDPLNVPVYYHFYNDTIYYTQNVMPKPDGSFDEATGLWNIKTNTFKLLAYNHPDVKKKRIYNAIIPSNNQYVEFNFRNDLISFFDLEGNLIYNIFGPNWNNDKLAHFYDCVSTDKYLVAPYNGFTYTDYKPTTMCHIFTLKGDYLATIDLGYSIMRIAYDKLNNRIFFWFNDVIQCGYIDIDNLNLQ
ncbi:MAG: hypothetical protein MJ211_14795 [Bacteroidales bacterium]|nr:hypothetical protein [Bacteroidales bacterium]